MLHFIEKSLFVYSSVFVASVSTSCTLVVLFIKYILHPVSFSAGSTAVKCLIDVTSCDAQQTLPFAACAWMKAVCFSLNAEHRPIASSLCVAMVLSPALRWACCHGDQSEWQLGPGALACLRGHANAQLYARLGVSVFRASLRLSAYADLFDKL